MEESKQGNTPGSKVGGEVEYMLQYSALHDLQSSRHVVPPCMSSRVLHIATSLTSIHSRHFGGDEPHLTWMQHRPFSRPCSDSIVFSPIPSISSAHTPQYQQLGVLDTSSCAS